MERDAKVWDAKLKAVLEHWVCYLRQPGVEADGPAVSLFWVRHSPAGEGRFAFVSIDGFEAVCADNAEVAEYVTGMMIRGRSPRWDRPLPVVASVLTFSADIRHDPAWTIRTPDRTIDATWGAIEAPAIAYRTDPAIATRRCAFTVLFFAREAGISVNGQATAARPYEVDVWRDSIGGRRSSCCFALAETFIDAAGAGT